VARSLPRAEAGDNSIGIASLRPRGFCGPRFAREWFFLFCPNLFFMSRILLVDDHVEFLTVQQELLENAGHTVVAATDGFKALVALESAAFDLVITDIIMPRKEGIETIMELRRRHPGLKIIAMSGGGRVGAWSYLELADKLEAFETLEKPFSGATLLAAVDAALKG
jgi:DNA-binding NtrC family response regulator